MGDLDVHREIGSEFHWEGIPRGPFMKWPEPCRMVASGRDALLRIWHSLKISTTSSLFVPHYFCDDVAHWWKQQGITIQRYSDSPHWASPAWETLTVSKGDVVLAVNYFGIRDGIVWKEWMQANNGVLIIEDHTHDPLSGWAVDSIADYAFSSLRKTFPIPDGAIVWSPKKLPLPAESPFENCTGSALKLSAMILKKDYLDEGRQDVKDFFRNLQEKGETLLKNSSSIAISPLSRFLLDGGFPILWRERREKNIITFLDLIKSLRRVQPLFTDWPERNCPYNVVLLFPSREERDKCGSSFIKSAVYPSVHWELTHSPPLEISELSSRILTLPADQRYDDVDMKRMASILHGELNGG